MKRGGCHHSLDLTTIVLLLLIALLVRSTAPPGRPGGGLPDRNADAATLGAWLHAVEARCPVSDDVQNSTHVKVVLG